ncbi:hypothetical protein AQUCO_00900892v1 [Aquilegia coerulea]|uniref:Uncharacterized protein n=1 Tax=Aquilegia coerulea TaxID=218851 RepID=A0A2G5EFW1_AQUCA|nr:hypothetical protein AQUCO_00900892v1 [Aquilegia coerulea]
MAITSGSEYGAFVGLRFKLKVIAYSPKIFTVAAKLVFASGVAEAEDVATSYWVSELWQKGLLYFELLGGDADTWIWEFSFDWSKGKNN